MIFDGDDWIAKLKKNVVDTIYDDKKDLIEVDLNDLVATLSENKQQLLKSILESDDDTKTIKNIKEEIKLLLHNKRKLPMEGNKA